MGLNVKTLLILAALQEQHGEVCLVTFSNSTENLSCKVIKLSGMDNTVSNDDCIPKR